MARISYLDCKHNNVQTFTDWCLDCDQNINMSNEEYLQKLRKEVKAADPVVKEIRELEKKLGMG